MKKQTKKVQSVSKEMKKRFQKATGVPLSLRLANLEKGVTKW